MRFYLIVYALYVFLNKGVAYTYLAELTWLFGILLVFRNWHSYRFPLDKRVILILAFLLIGAIYTIVGFSQYPVLDVVRDSFMFNYMAFIFIIPLFHEDFETFRNGIYRIYKWLPIFVLTTFIVKTKVLNQTSPALFGGIPILEYKNGDLAVQLLITALLLITGKINYSLRFQFLNAFIVVYLFFLVATFNRGGMLAFLTGITAFFYWSRYKLKSSNLKAALGVSVILLSIALIFYSITNIKDPVQGRDTGLGQLGKNLTSIVSNEDKSSLSGNVVWRLIWWGKIVSYTFTGPHFLAGKGLGVNLALSDEILIDDDSLRSPHNYSLNILARFGVPVFLGWLLFLVFSFTGIRKRALDTEQLLYLSVFLAFLVNASFDVALEGPMSAFPCWSILGILFFTEMKTSNHTTIKESA